MPSYHLISVDQATSEQLNTVHEIIKQHANGWWHNFTNLWIVGGESAQFWRDQVKGAVQSGDASVLVFKLPDAADERNWSFFGVNPEKKCAWLHKNYKK